MTNPRYPQNVLDMAPKNFTFDFAHKVTHCYLPSPKIPKIRIIGFHATKDIFGLPDSSSIHHTLSICRYCASHNMAESTDPGDK